MSLLFSAEFQAPEAGAQTNSTCFSIAASADPGVMSRLLELFAKRGLVPNSLHGRRHGADQEELAIDIQVVDLSQQEARHVAACMRQIPFVSSVLTYDRRVATAER